MSNEHRPLVMIAVPTRGRICHEVVGALLSWTSDARVRKLFLTQVGNPCDAVRNLITERFLGSAAEFLITVDDDNPPLRNPIDLVFEDKDVVALPTPIIWGGKRITWNIYKRTGENLYDTIPQPEGAQFVRVEAAGAGCLVIKRRVLESIPAAFSCVVDATSGKIALGTDLAFSKRVTDAGFELWAHFGYCCRHIQSVDLWNLVEASRSE
ncbi:hypothetical protein LCGC14_1473410 [marine sediment metagenome]|uniref:Glycosyltransferase 2-like domain-containing protein n=1 Tax=marine sediment metagenome TaxID=412755 RepID=A0A0F9JBM2_9ZZZZ